MWDKVPEPADGFVPHVSIAYSNAAVPAGPVAEALAKIRASEVSTRVDSVELIVLHRDRRMYEWESYASVRLAPSG
ncbi:2'-5' RNA ligase family protein [Streptomyces roseifaciens]